MVLYSTTWRGSISFTCQWHDAYRSPYTFSIMHKRQAVPGRSSSIAPRPAYEPVVCSRYITQLMCCCFPVDQTDKRRQNRVLKLDTAHIEVVQWLSEGCFFYPITSSNISFEILQQTFHNTSVAAQLHNWSLDLPWGNSRSKEVVTEDSCRVSVFII